MALTKAQLIQQVLTAVKSGRHTDDVPVKWAMVENLLPSAINFVIVGEHRLRRDERRSDLAATDVQGGADPGFIAMFEEDVSTCSRRKRKYVALSRRVQSLPHGLGLDDVAPCNGQLVSFVRVNSESELMVHDEAVLGQQTWYWFEQTQNTHRLYFHNLSPFVDKVRVNMVASVTDLEDDDPLPLPEGVDMQVLNYLVQHFTGYRERPVDPVADGNDENTNVR